MNNDVADLKLNPKSTRMHFLSSKYFLWLLLSVPAVLMSGTALQDVGSAGNLLHGSGELSARFMIVAMIATPLKLMFSEHRWPFWLLKNRRYFGVAAFGYALLHTLFYLIDRGSATLVFEELPALGIWTGWAAFAIFIPLAITSNNTSQKLLKRHWKSLQRWVYPAAVLTLIHWIFVHNDLGPALVHFIPLAALEVYRVAAGGNRMKKNGKTPKPADNQL